MASSMSSFFSSLRRSAPQLGQPSVDLVEFGGAGVSIQQPSGLELADAMALFAGLGDGPIDGQHGGIVPLERVSELLQLFQRRLEDDPGILLQLVVHPRKGGVQSGLRDSAHSAFRRAFIVLATDPHDQAAFPPPFGQRAFRIGHSILFVTVGIFDGEFSAGWIFGEAIPELFQKFLLL